VAVLPIAAFVERGFVTDAADERGHRNVFGAYEEFARYARTPLAGAASLSGRVSGRRVSLSAAIPFPPFRVFAYFRAFAF
jgi:hypothetical protein